MNLRRLYPGDAVVALLVVASVARLTTSALQVYFYPGSFVLPFPLVAWNDFYLTYVKWLHFVSQGMIPYRDFSTYTFTPLFLYTLVPFFLVGGAHAAAVPIVLADIATAPVVYILAKTSTSQRIALAAGLAYALSPLMLFYEGYLWISNQPMTLLLVLAVYFMRVEKPTASFAALALSVMFKQETLFALPLLLGWQVVRHRGSVWRSLGVFASIVVVVSLPFLVVAANQYAWAISYGLAGHFIPPAPAAVQAASASSLSSQAASSPPVLLQPCPEVIPTGGAPFACIRYPNPTVTLVLNSLNWMSNALAAPFVLLTGVAVILSRRARAQAELLFSYALLCFLFLFSLTVHLVLAYYFVPFYALLFASARTRSAVIASLAGSAVILIQPTGNFPLVIALASMLLLVGLQDQAHPPAVPGGPRERPGAADHVAEDSTGKPAKNKL